ncbi:ABC-type uncharacterized transport system permease subunit [Acinetobacter baylyi]|uniref:ABC-type uncharacterized transport system permease subunit n=1 Tax=Acinetobacter baylyi TaxID=202950 RepID=A0ABU0UTZ6_ACIBI|nr:hypothetical protein [Acinetobacter baylyi]MDQ1208019.1 ABC-type uncharacterized transport system permease subunit [Acinetobacter baylyi]MDR6104906.1 ABC-type uncharacterized transport system permease subunit [Acinetobacter baylyi]MDR6184891.1 ABC-type uncharacterized transport system permease subunit [Acinetobacter baylyi]
MKSSIFLISACMLALGGCATTGSVNENTTANTTQQLGMTALKIAVNAECINKINSIPAWQVASKLMTENQRQNTQTEICGCVSEKAPYSVTAVDLATATFDPNARASVVQQVVSNTVTSCINETFGKK